jgi:hypothetical protein
MAKMNVWKRMFPARTHEGAVAQKVDAKSELRRTVLTCLLWEDTFYEKGNDIAKRLAALAAENKAEVVAALAREARDKNAASSCAALPHARTRAPQGRGRACSGDA